MHFAVKSGLSLAVIAGRAALAVRFAGSAAPAAKAPALAVPVVTAPGRQHDVPIILGGLGTVQALNTAVLFTLPAANIAQVQDALASGEVPAVAFDQAGAQMLDTGKLLLVNNQADPQSGTVQLKALFPNLQRRLWPGIFVNVELTTSVAKAALIVPADAVQHGPQGTFVYTVGADSNAIVQPVRPASSGATSRLSARG